MIVDHTGPRKNQGHPNHGDRASIQAQRGKTMDEKGIRVYIRLWVGAVHHEAQDMVADHTDPGMADFAALDHSHTVNL